MNMSLTRVSIAPRKRYAASADIYFRTIAVEIVCEFEVVKTRVSFENGTTTLVEGLHNFVGNENFNKFNARGGI